MSTPEGGPSGQARQSDAPELIACPDCGLRQLVEPVPRGFRAQCGRCGKVLASSRSGLLAASLALLTAAALWWLPACLAPFMTVSANGAVRRSELASGIAALWSAGFPSLAVVVAAFSIVVPSLYLALMIGVLVGIRLRNTSASGRDEDRWTLGRLYRWALGLRPWAMIEVYLLGACVAYSRLQRVAFVRIGVAAWCLLATSLCILLADALLNDRAVWRALPIHSARSTSRTLTAAACHVCDLAIPGGGSGDRCPRCYARLVTRKPRSIERTWALVLCGFLLFVPANLLPVLTIDQLGQEESNTILGGVLELGRYGLWPLAVIVFTASILIPLTKLCGLSWNLFLTSRGSARFLVARTRLHGAIDWIGRWSNIDVFMVSIVAALVQFGELSHVRVEPGMIAFAAVVIVTMIAARSFDSRLMWDAAGERG
ncbi:MAG TPA: paraquat-inducible protein A [Steroidobacteraceae bacterium]|nr:paraquat-inducible protein A [Steroidobacteraceae bacterium]